LLLNLRKLLESKGDFMRNKSKYLASVLAMVMLVGCAKLHRTPNADGTPTAPVTQLESANASNAEISVHNHAVGEALVAAHQSGLLETSYFDRLSAGQIKITRIHEQLTPLLAQPVAANAAQIKGLLKEIGDIGASMVADGTAGVKNPTAQQRIVSEIQSIITLANSIGSTLTAAGVLK